MKKFTYFAFLSVLFFSLLLTGCAESAELFDSGVIIVVTVVVITIVLTIPITVLLVIARKKKEQRGKAQAEAEVAKQKETPMKEFLRQNGLEQYCDVFDKNNINNVFDAIELSDSDLLNIGISVLADRKKLNSLLAEKLSASKGPRDRCPFCGSTNFQQNSQKSKGGFGLTWICNDCKKQFDYPKWS